jgi:hypothetical protein
VSRRASSAKSLKIPPVSLRFLPVKRDKLHGKSTHIGFLEVPLYCKLVFAAMKISARLRGVEQGFLEVPLF